VGVRPNSVNQRLDPSFQRGRVIATEDFQKQIEAKVGRRLVGESWGRPRRIRQANEENVL
jgi:hypothetical protein